MKDVLAEEITLQMGRPISQTPGEITGTLARARHLIDIARESLKELPQTETDTDALKRVIRREPLGVVAVVAPWKSVPPSPPSLPSLPSSSCCADPV
jgi:acyl-CoA reductase-like NAD-dependent aldehyde dehydrogenase